MRNKKIPFIITISYFAAFIGIRIGVLIAGSAESKFAGAAKHGGLPDVDFYIGSNVILFGYHIHHFYFGIALICISGWLALVGSDYLKKEHIAILYGVGLGLFMDEIGLLLTWGDYYSGLTYTLSLFLAGILVNIVFFPSFWKEVKNTVIQHHPNSFFWKIALHNKNFIKAVDNLSETKKNHRASLIFIGVIYIAVGFLILIYPEFVYYWVAGGFFIQGVASLVRAWQSREEEEEEKERNQTSS